MWQGPINQARQLLIVGSALINYDIELNSQLFEGRSPHIFGAIVTNISACGVKGTRAGVQVSRREFHTHIHLD